MRTDNPVRGVERPADKKRDRRLTDEEYLRLGGVLRNVEASRAAWLPAVQAMRFLALTGWRSGEVLGLTWAAVELERRSAVLAETKTGRSIRAIGRPAVDILRQAQRFADCPLVFPSMRMGVMGGFSSVFARMIREADIPADVTPHVLRHSFASVAHDVGLSELAIGALLGHARHGTTAGYIHSADDVTKAAADKVAEEIAERMGDVKPQGVVVPMRAGG